MHALTGYLDEGISLALILVNTLSVSRQGVLTSYRSATPIEKELGHHFQDVLSSTNEAAASRKLNQLLGEAAAAPVLMDDGEGRWRLHLHSVNADEPSRQTVKAAAGLAALIDDGRWHAIKQCGAERCDDYFLDQSRNQSRKFCSRTCANRINAQSHRDRN